ncbi:hypothetical protein ACMAUO_12690 [Gluconacetobacter sp. Hr-1-5]|uniref:hypothetical protein n=1 Tax=Gluconacetobacter sp. Hr-1-5 TaxID=3395370 RepID=UPI003B52A604
MTGNDSQTLAAIKTATANAIARVGGVHAAETICRVGNSQLSDYQNPHRPSIVPVDVALDLDRRAHEPVILREIARIEGYALMPIHVGSGSVAASMERVSVNSSAALQTTIRILADGIVTEDEARELSADLHGLLTVVHDALHVCQARLGSQQRVVPIHEAATAGGAA